MESVFFFTSQSGDFAGGGAEKTPAGDYSINTNKGLHLVFGQVWTHGDRKMTATNRIETDEAIPTYCLFVSSLPPGSC
jgi:hypothetical protein